MRGEDERTEDLFSSVSREARVPADHPLRAMADEALEVLSPEFNGLLADSPPAAALITSLCLLSFRL